MRSKSATTLVVLFAVSACSSPDPRFFTLQAVDGTPVATQFLSIEVRRPGLAGYLDRSDIILKNAEYSLNMSSQQRWGEPLGDMIGRVLTQDLAQRLPNASLFTQGGAISADPQLRVEVDVQNFDTDASGTLVLNAAVAVERGITHQPLATHHVSLTAPQGAADAASLAASMSGLLGKLADFIARDIKSVP